MDGTTNKLGKWTRRIGETASRLPTQNDKCKCPSSQDDCSVSEDESKKSVLDGVWKWHWWYQVRLMNIFVL